MFQHVLTPRVCSAFYWTFTGLHDVVQCIVLDVILSFCMTSRSGALKRTSVLLFFLRRSKNSLTALYFLLDLVQRLQRRPL